METPNEIRQIARELGRRWAAAAALLVALIALIQHAPVWLACLQGVATLITLTVLIQLGTAALARSMASDRAMLESKKETS